MAVPAIWNAEPVVRDARDVAEVLAWFGPTLIAVGHVPSGRAYTIGTEPGVDLVIAPGLAISRFTLVDTHDAFVLYRPPNVRARRIVRGRSLPIADATVEIVRGVPIELSLGALQLRISLVRIPSTLPRRSIERRPYVYAAVSLVAQLAVYLVAARHHEPALPTPQVAEAPPGAPARQARIAMPAQSVRRSSQREPVATPVAEPTPPPASGGVTGARIGRGAQPAVPGTAAKPGNDEGRDGREAHADAPRFDPQRDPSFDSVRTGNYTTVSTGRAAGSDMQLLERGQRSRLVVVRCDSAACVVVGGEQAKEIREKLQHRLPDIVACYRDRAPGTGREVEMDFQLDGGGKVQTLEVGGIGDVDSCVASIVRGIQFAET